MWWHARFPPRSTGMKCLPAAKLKEANGNGLHDWHAEILAIRALNHFLLTEARELSSGDGKDTDEELRLLRWTTPADREAQAGMSQPFTIRQDVKLYMYSSEAPCKSSMRVRQAAGTLSTLATLTPFIYTPPGNHKTYRLESLIPPY